MRVYAMDAQDVPRVANDEEQNATLVFCTKPIEDFSRSASGMALIAAFACANESFKAAMTFILSVVDFSSVLPSNPEGGGVPTIYTVVVCRADVHEHLRE